jgi:hypothetical protein
MKNYQHQQKIIDEDPKKTGLFLGTGSGKTRTALMLAEGRTLVIAPKTQIEDKNWPRENSKLAKPSKYLMTISKEGFRKDHEILPTCDTLIVDEAHTCLGVTPSIKWQKREPRPGSSQLFEALQAYVARVQPARIYLVTATIMRSPMTVWAAGKLLGKRKGDMADYYVFRGEYYTKLPMPGRDVWIAKTDPKTKKRLAALVRSYGHVGRLDDFFDVPEQSFKTVFLSLTAKQEARIKDMKLEYPEPIVRVGKVHQIENGVLSGDEFNAPEFFPNAKIEAIEDLASQYQRMVVFAKYRAQIDQLAAALKKTGHTVMTMTGDTKDRGDVIATANELDECIFIVQAQISAGWELPDYPLMVFASRTYSFVDYDQAIGRIQRANKLKKNLYVNLVVEGGVDEAVHDALENKKDFNEKLYTKI